MSIFKKTINDVVGKTQVYTAATSLSIQQKAKENGISQEINRLKVQRDNIGQKIGQKTYELYLKGGISNKDLLDLCALMDEAAKYLNEQEQLLKTVQEEYNSQIEIIKKGSLAANQTGNCPQCGLTYTIGLEFFCRECGMDLREKIHSDTQVCSNCNKPFNNNDIFCKHCGNKVR